MTERADNTPGVAPDSATEFAPGFGSEAAPEALPSPAFDPRMLESLVCPNTHGVLTYDAKHQELVSRAAHLAYPIRSGIPVMLVDEAREID